VWFDRTKDLSHSVSPTIKNSKGQPAELWWWRPSQSPGVIQYPKDFKDPSMKDFADQNGEIIDNWRTDWLVNKWHKVAKIEERTKGQVKVHLLSPPPTNQDQFRDFIAYSAEMTRNRSIWSIN